jgi:hypothetical protein
MILNSAFLIYKLSLVEFREKSFDSFFSYLLVYYLYLMRVYCLVLLHKISQQC